MGYKDDNKRRKRFSKKHIDISSESFYTVDIVQEKQRARTLRNSTWWKRKIADGRCHYCGKEFKPSELTMDHKIPLARGGRSEKENLVPACKECNNQKKHLLPVEWEEYMNRIRNT